MPQIPSFRPFLPSVLCALVMFATSHGQEHASLPDLGVDMLHSGPSVPQPLPITPMAVEGGMAIQLDRAELYHILPLRWELEKREIYRSLIESEIASVGDELDKTSAKQEQILDELAKLGTMTQEQLDKNHLSLQEANLELSIIEAESAALREAIRQRKESVSDQRHEKMNEAVRFQKELVQFLEEKRNNIAQLRKSGAVPPSELAEHDAELLRGRRELALMEAEAMQQADAVLDAILSRLTAIEPRRKATAAKIGRLSGLAENAAYIRQLINKHKQTQRGVELLEQRKGELITRLREQNLRTDYLKEILGRYESSLQKAKSSAQKKQGG